MIDDYYAINGSQDKSLTLSDQPNDDTQNPNMKQSYINETYHCPYASIVIPFFSQRW